MDKKDILIVDDDPRLRKTLSDILKAKGYTPITAAEGKEALDKVREKGPALALIDLKLEDMSGLEVLKGIKEYSPGTECIVITGHASQESAIKAVNLGAYSYVRKPYDMEQLLLTVQRAIEKQAAEESLRENTERLLKAQRIAKMGFLDWNLKTNEMVWSDQIYDLYSVDKRTENSSLELTMKLMHPDDREFVEKNLEMAIKGEKEYDIDHRILRPDGKIIWVHAQAELVRDADGNPERMLGTAIDITDRELAKLKLQDNQKKFQTLFDMSPQAIILTDIETGAIIDFNDRFCELSGYSRKDILESNITATHFYSKSNRKRFLKEFRKTGSVQGMQMDFQIKDSSIKTALMYSKMVKISGLSFILTIFTDITMLIKLQTQLQQTQKMETIGTLAGGIAHDFNNILFPILGHTELLLMDTPDDSPSIGNLKAINTAALRAKSLVKQILTFSRQDSSELILMKVQPIIKESLKLIRSTISTTVEIKHDINPDCGLIRADPTQIHQIIMNLATNAYHAMEETGGELRVGLKEIEIDKQDVPSQIMEPGVYACLTIADTGIGMNKELIEKIFDPFFTTKEKGKGTGMGLSVVHGIVNKMGGTIRVYSEPGKGSEFNVYFPVEKSSSEEQSVQPKEPIACGNEQILLVDDEEAILTMEKQVLERLGYQVTSRTSSLEALEAFRANPDRFDLVITDTAMPNMPGAKLSGELIKIRPDIPILLCTGFSQTMSEEKAASMGIKGFLLKPIVMKDLAQKIRDVLDEAKRC